MKRTHLGSAVPVCCDGVGCHVPLLQQTLSQYNYVYSSRRKENEQNIYFETGIFRQITAFVHT